MDIEYTKHTAKPIHIWEEYLKSRMLTQRLELLWDAYQQPVDEDALFDLFGTQAIRDWDMVDGEHCVFGGRYRKLNVGDFVGLAWVNGRRYKLTQDAVRRYMIF